MISRLGSRLSKRREVNAERGGWPSGSVATSGAKGRDIPPSRTCRRGRWPSRRRRGEPGRERRGPREAARGAAGGRLLHVDEEAQSPLLAHAGEELHVA